MARVYSFIEVMDRELQMLAQSLDIEGPANFEFVTHIDEDGRRRVTALWTHRKGKLHRAQLDRYVIPLELEPMAERSVTPPDAA